MKNLFNAAFISLPSGDEVEVTVFGNGCGESIVTFIPHVGWGVIDCCSFDDGYGKIIPPLQYILECSSHMKEVPPLAFVVLTHPHLDHYDGMDDLLRTYPGRIERVCRYDGDGVREFKYYLARESVATKTCPRISKVLAEFAARAKKDATFKRLNSSSYILSCDYVFIDGYGETNIRLMSLSPSGESVERYKELLYRQLVESGQVFKPLDDSSHNMICVALMLEIGKVKILFSSDIETGCAKGKTGWEGVIDNPDLPTIDANIVKIAHHGSSNGYSEKAWSIHKTNGKPISILTPYDKHDLPALPVLNDIASHSTQLGVSSVTKCYNKLTKFYSKEVSMATASILKNPRLVRKPKEIGAARVRIKLDGSSHVVDSHGPGSWLGDVPLVVKIA